MFNHIAIALDPSPESARALESGIHLARQLNTALCTVTVKEPLPAFHYFATAADSSAMRMLQDDHDRFYRELIEKAVHQAGEAGVAITSSLLEGDRVDTIVDFVSSHKIDLLVIGLHRSSLRTHSLWSTVYTLAQGLRCSMLGVH
jgi:nucleotide-binding universal stress UspA family protein